MMRYLIFGLSLLFSCADSTVHYDLVEMDHTINTDSATNSRIQPYRDSLDAIMGQILVYSSAPIPRGRPDSPLGSLIADVILEEAKRETPSGQARPEFCMLNIGGLRIDMPKGDIALDRVFELMPFENELCLVHLTPEGMKAMIKYLVSIGGQPISGMTMLVKDSTATMVQINKLPLEPRGYWVATSDYLADGGDKMDFFKLNDGRVDLKLKFRDAIIRNFQALGSQNRPLTAPIDHRIIVTK